VCFAATVYYRSTSPNFTFDGRQRLAGADGARPERKTVAVNGLRNTPQLSTEVWLDKNGADSKSVKFTEVPFEEMGLALTSGRVDAAFFSEPALSLVRTQLRVLGDPYGAIAPQFITGSYFTTRTYATAQPALVANVGRALRQRRRGPTDIRTTRPQSWPASKSSTRNALRRWRAPSTQNSYAQATCSRCSMSRSSTATCPRKSTRRR